MKLRNRINLSTSFLFIGLMIIMNVSIYYVFSNLLIDSELDQAKAEAEKTVEGINRSLGTISAKELLRAYVPVDGMIQIVTSDQKKIAPVTSPSQKELSKRDAEYYLNERSERIEVGGESFSFTSIPIILTDGEVANLQLVKSLQTTVDDLAILRLVLLSVTLIAMVPVIVSSALLSNVITMPVTSLIETMTEIRRNGNFKRIKLEKEAKDELYEMGETFNHMISLLETNFEKQDQFVGNASHELRTPITIIESYASLIKRRGLQEPEIFHESIEAIHSEAVRMKEMVEQLLLLAKHHEEWNIQFEIIDLSEHIQQTVKSFERAYQRKIQLQLDHEEVLVMSDEQRLKQLTYIILDNAKKYSEDVITVEVEKRAGKAFIRIIDRGLGIPKEDLSKVFDRFYRVDKARSRKKGGTGLGLALANEIALAMKAELQLDSLEGVGTTVTIHLPLAQLDSEI